MVGSTIATLPAFTAYANHYGTGSVKMNMAIARRRSIALIRMASGALFIATICWKRSASWRCCWDAT